MCSFVYSGVDGTRAGGHICDSMRATGARATRAPPCPAHGSAQKQKGDFVTRTRERESPSIHKHISHFFFVYETQKIETCTLKDTAAATATAATKHAYKYTSKGRSTQNIVKKYTHTTQTKTMSHCTNTQSFRCYCCMNVMCPSVDTQIIIIHTKNSHSKFLCCPPIN